MRDLVQHAPTGLLLDFAEDDFGGDRQAAIIDRWRKTHSAEQGEFICYQHRDRERPWLYLQQRGSLLVAAHWPGTLLAGTHEISHGMSDEHKRQVEYVSRAGAVAGFRVEQEVRLPGVRSDAVIYGPVNMGVEAQRSALTATAAKARTTKARKVGVQPIWFSDNVGGDPSWFGKVPGVRMTEQSWNTVPKPRTVVVGTGVRVIIPRRCQDIRGLGGDCPYRRHGCNAWHAVHEPRLGTYVDDLAALVPAGELVPIQYKAPSGRGLVIIVSRIDKARYEELAGRPADLPLAQRQAALRSGDRVDCTADAGRRVVVAMPARPRVVAPSICEHWIGAEERYCHGADEIRRYMTGPRCPLHTPAELARKATP